MKISVTQQHIDEGAKADCANCPVAKAIIEQTGLNVAVCDIYATVYREGLPVQVIDLPPVATDFINDFDEDEPVEPFEFELDIL